MTTADLVADGLTDQGFDVQDPVLERAHFLKVTNARHAYCEIMISEEGAVTWEYRRFDERLGPAQMTGMALSILGSDGAGGEGKPVTQQPGQTLKGTVGQALRERGMQVGVKILNPDDLCELDAEVWAVNPAVPSRGTARVNDNGMVRWDCCLTEPDAETEGVTLDELVNTIAGALLLAEQTG